VYADSAAAAAAAFRRPGALDAPCAVSYGPAPGSVYGSADGLAEVQAFEGLIGDFGDDLEVLVQVQDKSAPRVTPYRG
jgi:hypothetical protein